MNRSTAQHTKSCCLDTATTYSTFAEPSCSNCHLQCNSLGSAPPYREQRSNISSTGTRTADHDENETLPPRPATTDSNSSIQRGALSEKCFNF